MPGVVGSHPAAIVASFDQLRTNATTPKSGAMDVPAVASASAAAERIEAVLCRSTRPLDRSRAYLWVGPDAPPSTHHLGIDVVSVQQAQTPDRRIEESLVRPMSRALTEEARDCMAEASRLLDDHTLATMVVAVPWRYGEELMGAQFAADPGFDDESKPQRPRPAHRKEVVDDDGMTLVFVVGVLSDQWWPEDEPEMRGRVAGTYKVMCHVMRAEPAAKVLSERDGPLPDVWAPMTFPVNSAAFEERDGAAIAVAADGRGHGFGTGGMLCCRLEDGMASGPTLMLTAWHTFKHRDDVGDESAVGKRVMCPGSFYHKLRAFDVGTIQKMSRAARGKFRRELYANGIFSLREALRSPGNALAQSAEESTYIGNVVQCSQHVEAADGSSFEYALIEVKDIDEPEGCVRRAIKPASLMSDVAVEGNGAMSGSFYYESHGLSETFACAKVFRTNAIVTREKCVTYNNLRLVRTKSSITQGDSGACLVTMEDVAAPVAMVLMRHQGTGYPLCVPIDTVCETLGITPVAYVREDADQPAAKKAK